MFSLTNPYSVTLSELESFVMLQMFILIIWCCRFVNLVSVEIISLKVVHQPGHVIRSAERVVGLATVAMATFVMKPAMVCIMFVFFGGK